MATVQMNGKDLQLPEHSTALDAVIVAGFDTSRIAVEIDGEVCPRAALASYELQGGEKIEVVSFVGGG